MLVILTEKPSAARNFASALGGKRGRYNNEEYSIISARGHLLEFDAPDNQVSGEISEKYKYWNVENLPWKLEDIKWKKRLKTDTEKTINMIRLAIEYADEVVIATDDDPTGEGELLAWEILDYCGWKGSTSRMYFTDEAPGSIRTAFVERKPLVGGSENDGDYIKADTRSKWDYMSMQFTRIATCVAREHGYRTVLRQGRLKSVMTYLVGKQLDDIKKYRKTPFYEVRFRDEEGNVYASRNSEDIRSLDKNSTGIEKYTKTVPVVDSEQEKSKAPVKLLDLASLSAILAQKGYGAGEVLKTYQKMYEAQIVSYPRTEDKVITEEQFNELLPLAGRIAHAIGVDAALLTYKMPRKTHVKNGGTHGANRPGPNVPKTLNELSEYGRAAPEIYELLARNYLAMLAGDYKYKQIKAHLKDYPDFAATVNIPQDPGYKIIFDDDIEESDDPGNDNAEVIGTKAEPFIYEGVNKKPQKPTMKWLIKRLEKYNVGTGATRTSTIAEISDPKAKYALMKEEKGVLSLSAEGELSYILLDGCRIASAEVTEALYQDMKKTGAFEKKPSEILAGIDDLIMHDIRQMKNNAKKLPPAGNDGNEVKTSLGRCPLCGKNVRQIQGRKGSFYTCSDRECSFWINGIVAGKKITESMVEQLLDKGRTGRLKGFRKKTGETFSAALAINDDLTGVKFV